MTRALADRIRFMRRVSGALLASTALLWMVLADRSQHNSLSSSTVALRALSALPKHPVIYAFRENGSNNDNNNSTHNHQDEELRQWRTAWTEAGWETRLLTLEDAARHPSFEFYQKEIGEILPFGHDEAKAGYYRFLAMAAVGGGWLGDTSVLPLWNFRDMNRYYPDLLDSREFTVRCATSRHASSCLMSGSEHEWTRIAAELTGSIRRYYRRVYSDQNEVHQQNTATYNGSNDKDVSTVSDSNSSPTVTTTTATTDVAMQVWTSDLALEELVTFANPTGRPRANNVQQVLSRSQAEQLLEGGTPFQKDTCHDLEAKLAVQFSQESSGSKTNKVDGGDNGKATWMLPLRWMTQWGLDCSGFQAFDYHHTRLSFPSKTQLESDSSS